MITLILMMILILFLFMQMDFYQRHHLYKIKSG